MCLSETNRIVISDEVHLIAEKFKQEYKEMSDDGIDEFNKEIIEYLLNAFPSAQAAAKVVMARKGL